MRVAKYDVRLRDQSLRAVQAMHAILSRMVLFQCGVCRERFPTFHPAYAPPPLIAQHMELLKRGNDGLAACCVEVAEWDELPPLDAPDGIAQCCYGTCARCRKEMDVLAKATGCEEVVPRFSSQNHMDPLFRFPFSELKWLFDQSTLVESMLVALEHMQVNFITMS